jgi:hypothetical protein
VPVHERKETDPRIHSLTAEVAEGKATRYIEEMIDTALGFGRDHARYAELKLMNRAFARNARRRPCLRPLQPRSQGCSFRQCAHKTLPTRIQPGALLLEKKIVEAGDMLITGGGDGIMGAAQAGAGAAKSFGLNVRLPFEQAANPVIHGDTKASAKLRIIFSPAN